MQAERGCSHGWMAHGTTAARASIREGFAEVPSSRTLCFGAKDLLLRSIFPLMHLGLSSFLKSLCCLE